MVAQLWHWMAVGQRERRRAAGRVARVDAGHLDVLHDGAHVDVARRRTARRGRTSTAPSRKRSRYTGWSGVILRGLGHVLFKLRAVVDDAHAAPAQHVAGAHEQREADLVGHHARLFERGAP